MSRNLLSMLSMQYIHMKRPLGYCWSSIQTGKPMILHCSTQMVTRCLTIGLLGRMYCSTSLSSNRGAFLFCFDPRKAAFLCAWAAAESNEEPGGMGDMSREALVGGTELNG